MISKRLSVCIIFLLIVKTVPCQIKDTIKSTSFFDADSIYMGTFYKTNEILDSTVYQNLEGNRINVLFKLPKYRHGYGSLKLFLLDQFRERLNYEEVNGAAIVYILLVKNKIKEIRIGKRIGYNSKYDPLIKEILMKTEGNWIVAKGDSSKPVLFVYLFEMK